MPDYLSLPQRLLQSLDANDSPRLQLFRTDSGWQSISSREFLRRVACLSATLARMGVAPGDRVGLFAPNSPEWHTADFAITGLGAIVVPIYFHESAERMSYILNDAGAKILFVAGDDQARQVGALHGRLSTVERVILAPLGGRPGDRSSCTYGDPLWFDSVVSACGDAEIAEYRRRAAQVTLGQLATIIYTSGTTGEPKGVMLTHRNLSSNATDACPKVDFREGEIGLSFLPLAHIYERTVDYMYLFEGMTIAYVEKMDDVARALLEVQPSVAAAVPRFFEKLYANILERGRATTGFRRVVFDWAIDTAHRAAPWKAYGQPAALELRLAWSIADALVYKKFRTGVGGRIRSFVSGGGPLSPELNAFFWTVGLPVYQGYGLTETAPIVSSNWPAVHKNGTSGKPIPNLEVRIAPDGEIEVRGPSVMTGYYNRPDETREAISPDGWFRTGDIGHIDRDGYLLITDRKKDLLKTAGGKFVAPQPIENLLKTSPFIANAIVVGDRRKFVSALIVPNLPAVEAEARSTGIPFANSSELVSSPWTHGLIESEINRLSADMAQYEKIKKFALLPQDFTFSDGEVTYTLKLRRRIIEQRFAKTIDTLYDSSSDPHS
ncbi:MAG TPA: long-chain fatty acid--CoA ligase [Candidatus Acidoferrales bacterium]|nr:long-chain fatty acid--CoA ligase [Candidatus Acidoferrales bacterium]